MTNFLAEIGRITDSVVMPTPSNGLNNQAFNDTGVIYEFDIGPHPTLDGDPGNYWLEWGGWYDSFTGHDLMVYFGVLLQAADDVRDMRNMRNSIIIVGTTAYVNIPHPPWLYPENSKSLAEVNLFLSAPLNPEDPSNNGFGGRNAPVRLGVPSFVSRLSDGMAGIFLHQGFSVTLDNHDGRFDNDFEGMGNIFNTDIRVSKTTVDSPALDDFRPIRIGRVENKRTTFDSVHFEAGDRLRTLEAPASRLTSAGMFDFEVTHQNGLNRPMPIVFGTARVRLIRLSDSRYFTAENAVSVERVFDRDGNVVASSPALDGDGTIAAPANAYDALVVGSQGDKIGQVVKSLMERAGVEYVGTNFDLEEFDGYTEVSPRVNLTVAGGDTRRAIENALKSDAAFLIQKTDGRFTIRKYGKSYSVHRVPPWVMTGKPEKTYGSAHENYFSSCVVNFSGGSILFREREGWAEARYWRLVRRTFETDLASANAARELAVLLSDRYTAMRQTVRLALGADTSGWELLDTVRVDLDINGRKFDGASGFFVKEINHAQDVVVLEELPSGDGD